MVEVTDKVKEMILEDIKKCGECLAPYVEGEINRPDPTELFDSLKTKYLHTIPDFKNGITDHTGMSGGLRRRTVEAGLRCIKSKLEVFVANDYKTITNSKNSSRDININNTITNTNVLDFNTNINTLINNVQNNDSLSTKETEEIVNKIKEISVIINDNTGRKEKWSRLKSTLIWLADKGVDVAVQLLPIIIAGIK